MTVKLNQPKYSITDEQQARLINASDLGDKIAYEFKSNLEKVIGKIKDQDDKVEDSFGYVLKGLVSTIHYQIKNRNKWNGFKNHFLEKTKNFMGGKKKSFRKKHRSSKNNKKKSKNKKRKLN